MKAHQVLIIALFGFLACNLFNSAVAFQAEILKIGTCNQYNELIETRNVDKSYKPLWVSETEKTFGNNNYSPISCIIVYNIKDNKHPAKVIVRAGGPGNNFVTLKFKSDRGHGIHTKVEIYRRRY